jgi:hypothetical protein
VVSKAWSLPDLSGLLCEVGVTDAALLVFGGVDRGRLAKDAIDFLPDRLMRRGRRARGVCSVKCVWSW